MQEVLAEGATKYPHSQHLVIVAAHDERLAPSCVRDRQQTKAQTTSDGNTLRGGQLGQTQPPSAARVATAAHRALNGCGHRRQPPPRARRRRCGSR